MHDRKQAGVASLFRLLILSWSFRTLRASRGVFWPSPYNGRLSGAAQETSFKYMAGADCL